MTGFDRVLTRPLPSLGCELQLWHHASGATHLHLASDDTHRAFCVGFRTQPTDDSGLPHVLEHTVLCGSQRYPVRDPFFLMLRRSLQTFMNAMTYSDLTCYPFATQVTKDFDHLLGVYLDAVFAPQLTSGDFAQEGHRLEFDEQGRPIRKGIVFNEMKGAMDATAALVEQEVARSLLPRTCHRWNSGGDPTAIPSLAHADLIAAHRRWYVPANACFATYGRLVVEAVHACMAPYLRVPGTALPPPAIQPAGDERQEIDLPVPLGAGQVPEDTSATSLTWTVGDGADLDSALDWELIDHLLLGHAGSPLRRALEGCGLGRSTGSSGLHASYRTLLFSAELDGLDPADYHRLPSLIETCLSDIAREGCPAEDVTAAVDQLELSRREIGGDGYPFGLDLCLRGIQAWNLGQDPLASLDQDPAIARLRTRWTDPGRLGALIRRHLLDNPHCVLIRAQPDRTWHQRAEAAERRAAEQALTALGPAGPDHLRASANALATHQAKTVDPDVLPALGRSDIPNRRPWLDPAAGSASPAVFVAPTNGLLHQVVAIPIADLLVKQLDLLPLLAECIGAVGVGRRGFEAQAAHLNRVCGGLWAWMDYADAADGTGIHAHLVLETKGLAGRHADFAGLIAETLEGQRHDEDERLKELIDQDLQRLQDRVSSSGHRLAAAAASRGFGRTAGFGHPLKGLGRLALLRTWSSATEKTPAILSELGERLSALLRMIANRPRQVAVIGDRADRREILAAIRTIHPVAVAQPTTGRGMVRSAIHDTAYSTATGVHYHALAWPVPGLTHADAPALAVAAQALTHGWLHPKIREQGGAYGGGAGYHPQTGIFTCTSYRDPRLASSLDDLGAAAAWIRDHRLDDRELTEAMLAAAAAMDAPLSPAGEARLRFLADLREGGPAHFDPFRAALTSVTADDVQQISRYLATTPVRATVTDATSAGSLTGWEQVEA